MIPVTVGELADLLGAEVARSAGDADAQVRDRVVTGLVADSRQVVTGSLFLALPGEHVDGHDYVAAAFESGAVAALTARPVPGAVGPCLVVDDPLAAAGRVARDQVDRGSAHGLRVAAITGSAGKTSTKDVLAHLLEAVGPTVAPVGNLNNELGVPLTICRVDERTRFLVAEMGARGIGHIAYLCTIAPPGVAVVLNVGSAHVGEFGGREQIAVAKGEIVEALSDDGAAVLNADDPLVWAMRTRTSGRVVATSAAVEPGVDDAVWASDIAVDALGRCAFTLREKWGGVSVPPARIQLGLAGRHQVANAVAAAATARCLGVGSEAVAAGLATARPRSRWRMELTERSDGVLLVNDAYNANPESMRAALDTVAAVLDERPGATGWAVLGDMLELGPAAPEEHRALGAYAVERGLTRVVAIGSYAEDLVEGAAGAAGLVEGAAGAAGLVEGAAGAAGVVAGPAVGAGRTRARAEVARDRDDAVRRVLADLAPGDVVLVKASRGLALDTVAAALTSADPVRSGDDQSEGSA